jgi:hypothetical protein
MNSCDEVAEQRPEASEIEDRRERLRAYREHELEALIEVEAEFDTIAAEPNEFEIFRLLGVDLGLDLTSREAIRRRCAELRRRLERR